VLVRRLPELRGWVRASLVGAAVAWALGMTPGTIMSLAESGVSGAQPEIVESLRLLLAATLGLVVGPLLAFFQRRRLRRCVTRRAAWWLPANASAWAIGTPIIVGGAHMNADNSHPLLLALRVRLSLLVAGAVVGAVHGGALVWLLSDGAPHGTAA